MAETRSEETSGANNWTWFGTAGATLAAIICCVGPALLVSFGVGGVWLSRLEALQAWEPYFLVAGGVFLAAGLYGKLRE